MYQALVRTVRLHPLLGVIMALVGVFVFLLIRNHGVFALPDVADGALIKIRVAELGFSLGGLEQYGHEYMWTTFNNAFQPLWFLIFYGLVWFDNNPVLLGTLSFALGAAILYLLFRIIRVYAAMPGKPADRSATLYAVFCALLFSSTLFFVELLAWKWMALLLVSTAAFLWCLCMILERPKPKRWLLVLYGIVLAFCIWTFGTGWIMAWALALFLLGRRYLRREPASPYLWVTVGLTIAGTLVALWANHTSAESYNVWFVLSHGPAMAAMVAANSLTAFIGVFRFTGITDALLGVSTVVALVIAGLLGYYTVAQVRARRLTDKALLCVVLVICFSVLVTMSLVRLMPPSGLLPTSSFDNYIFGNRYIFAFSLPLFIAVAIALSGVWRRLRGVQMGMAIVGAVVLGFVMQSVYAKTDAVITNPNRTAFYHATLPAMREASTAHIVLPNIESDLLFKELPLPLSRVTLTRRHTAQYPVQFVAPDQLTAEQCQAIQRRPVIRDWLNTYNNRDWC